MVLSELLDAIRTTRISQPLSTELLLESTSLSSSELLALLDSGATSATLSLKSPSVELELLPSGTDLQWDQSLMAIDPLVVMLCMKDLMLRTTLTPMSPTL